VCKVIAICAARRHGNYSKFASPFAVCVIPRVLARRCVDALEDGIHDNRGVLIS
jgi:hypothetical protein